jgi:hypothetical protein
MQEITMPNTLSGTDLRLQWSDFQGRAPAQTGNRLAFTSASFNLGTFRIVQAYQAIGIRMPDANNDLGYVIDHLQARVTLNRHQMWAVQSGQTPALLAHEQGHYDIVALTVSDLYTDLTTPPNVLTTIHAVQQYANGKIAAAQRRIQAMESHGNVDGLYDRQTRHGLNAGTQGNWNRAFVLARPPTGMRFDLALQAQGIIV